MRIAKMRRVMDTNTAIRTLLAVRRYQNKTIPEDIVRRIVDAARLSASAGNQQLWHFIVVTDREMLRKLGAAIRTGPYVAGAPLAIAVAIPKGNEYAVSDASRAIQSMMLTAWSDGVGSNWVGFRPMPSVSALLGVPDDLEVLAVVPFGYPETTIGRGKKKRKPLGEVAHRERFGQPYK